MTLSAFSTFLLKHCPDPYHPRRRKTRAVMVGKIGVGGDNPIRLQSMTTTDTSDTRSTVAQTLRMVEAGCEIVRITTPTVADARNLGKIKEELLRHGVDVPLVADVHFQPHAAMEAAEWAEKVRINPGNFVDSKRFSVKEYTDAQYAAEIERIEAAFTPLLLKLKRLKRALRVGTNHGSLSDRILNRYGDTPLGMVESALEYVRICEKNGFSDVILSMKASNPKVMIAAYRLLAARMEELGMDYPFHLGVTEAGGGEDGRIKSAIGIGSLLEDGIGDTIRVSLTEDPEFEIPVCRALAHRFQPLHGSVSPNGISLPRSQDLPYCRDPFSYARRKSQALRVGSFQIGEPHPVRVITPWRRGAGGNEILAFLEEQLRKASGLEPEILHWPIHTAQDLKDLESVRRDLAGQTSRIAFLGRIHAWSLAKTALSQLDLIAVEAREDARSQWQELLPALQSRGIPILIEGTVEQVLAWEKNCRRSQIPTVLSLTHSSAASLLHAYRWLAAQLAHSGAQTPIHIHAPKERNMDNQLLQSSILIGSLLCDGIGDSVQIDVDLNPEKYLRLLYNILQGAGARITKTEYVSCPSCGRTLFDLQSTTERIQSKTGHLKGVKIAIMGCIVNGPGEMADADFGYVGGAPGKINLYVGKECVRKGIPTEEADEALIELIQTHGKWTPPPAA